MSLSVQFETMMAMAAMGIWIGASIDTYGRFFPRRKRWNFLRIVNDVVFWLIQGLLVFYILLHINKGDVRIYIFLALFCGYAAYQGLLRSLYTRLLDTLIRSGMAVLRFVKRTINLLLFRPIKMLLQLLYSLGKIMARMLLAIMLFAAAVVWRPVKWLIPEAFLQQLKKTAVFLKKRAGILQYMKKLNIKIKQWFRKRRE